MTIPKQDERTGDSTEALRSAPSTSAAIEQMDQIIAGLATAVSNLNSALNELWGRDDCTTFAQPIGAPMLDRIMNAQNEAFFLASEAANKARAALSGSPAPSTEGAEKVFSAREVLTYMYAESIDWKEDVDGDEDRVYVAHDIRISDHLLDELLDMAGVKKARYDETPFQRLERANEEDYAAAPNAARTAPAGVTAPSEVEGK